MDSFCNKRLFPLIFIPLSALFLLVFSCSTNPFSTVDGFDSTVFKYMGQALAEGKVIYRDLFDNKGPILYFINAIPFFLGGDYFTRFPLFLLQLIGLSASMWFMYRTARLFAGGFWSLISLLVSLLLYIVFFEGGNLCEEWMLYGFAPALYVAMKWYLDLQNDKKVSLCTRRMLSDGFFYGFIFAYALFIRPNDAMGFIGGLLLSVSILTMTSKGKLGNLLHLYLGVFIGFSIITIPIVAWFAYHHALVDLWNGMFGVNIGYVGGNSLFFTLPIAKLPLLLCIILMMILSHCYGGWRLFVMITCPLCCLFVLFGHRMFLHYYISFIPFIVLGISFTAKVPRHMALMSLLVLLFVQPHNPNPYTKDKPLIRMARHKIASTLATFSFQGTNENHTSYEGYILTSKIPFSERASVWNDLISNCLLFPIFPQNGIVQCNRPIFNFGDNKVFQKDVLQSISEVDTPPLWVISTNVEHDSVLNISNSPYTEVFKTEHYSLFHLNN